MYKRFSPRNIRFSFDTRVSLSNIQFVVVILTEFKQLLPFAPMFHVFFFLDLLCLSSFKFELMVILPDARWNPAGLVQEPQKDGAEY